MAKFEGSALDKKLDKKGAKKSGMSMKNFEGSKADEKMDKMGSALMGYKKGGAVKRKKK